MSKPIIGRLYRPARFESRLSDGTYSETNLWPKGHEAQLQAALLRGHQCSVPWMLAAVIAAGAYVLVVMWGIP